MAPPRLKQPKEIPLYKRIEEWDITAKFSVPKVINPTEAPIFTGICGLDVENEEDTDAFLLLGIFDGTTYYGWTDFDLAKKVTIPKFAGHNGISDLRKLQKWGYKVNESFLVWDTQLIQHIKDSSQRTYKLTDVSKRVLNYAFPSYEDICGKKANKSHKPFTEQPIDLVISKNAADCYATYRLYQKQNQVSTGGLRVFQDIDSIRYFNKVEMPVSVVFDAMMTKGIRIDIPYLTRLEQELSSKRAVIEKKIKNELGDINLSSPKQLLEALNAKNIYPEFKGKPSTDKRALGRLNENRTIGLLLSFSELDTLLSSFVLPYLERGTEIVHPHFLQTGTRTGRPSCSNPNLLQIPRKTDNGKMVRRMFISRNGQSLGECDYGQIEPRLLAHLSSDKALLSMFNKGTDFHDYTAKKLNISRERAKVLNLSVGYRATFKSVSQQLNCTELDAQKQIDAWWGAFPELHAWQQKLIWQTRKDGYFTTLMGRRIKVDGLTEYNKWQKEYAERQLINNVAQAPATEIMKLGMIAVHKAGIDILVQVYDSLLVEGPTESIKEITLQTAELMKTSYKLDVPLTVDSGTGPTWADISKGNN